MAGIAALMRTKKERERKRQEHESLQDETGFSEVIPGKDKDGSSTPGAASQKSNQGKKSPATLKKAATDQSLLKKKLEKELEASNKKNWEQKNLRDALNRESYTPVYMGFVLFSLGLVITFVGLGEKGFRTVELRLIGPSLCCFGLSCVLFKVIQCHFPRLFVIPYWLKKARLSDSENSNLVEKGLQNGHLGNSNLESLQVLSPRVILQSSRKVPRPKSTIPNYIEDSSDDEDDFDTGQRRATLTHHHEYHSYDEKKNAEIILNPKTLML